MKIVAARELERCVRELGMRAAMLCGRTREAPMDAPGQEAIYEAAAALGVPLYIHPQIPLPAVRDTYYAGFGDTLDTFLATGGWGWHIETGVQALRLILSGVFDRHPALQVILGHWGETLAFYLTRVDEVSARANRLRRPVREYFTGHFWVTPTCDYPYQRAPGGGARRFLADATLSDADREKIAHGNWDRLTARPGQSDALASA